MNSVAINLGFQTKHILNLYALSICKGHWKYSKPYSKISGCTLSVVWVFYLPEIKRYVSISSLKPFCKAADWARPNVETTTNAYPNPKIVILICKEVWNISIVKPERKCLLIIGWPSGYV